MTLRILHLEDNLNDRELVRLALESDGLRCQLTYAADRDEFLAALRPDQIDLILSKYVLARFDGLEALALARDRCPQAPCIFVSSAIGEERTIESLRSGATDFVLKDNMARLAPSVLRAMRDAEERARCRQAQDELQSQMLTLKEQARELQESRRQLEVALHDLQLSTLNIVTQERLHAMGEMASGIAHDFNNTLSPICGYAEILLTRREVLDDRERLLDYLQIIHTSARDAAQVVGRLREFYRPRAPDELFRPVQLQSIVAQAISATQPRWKDQVQVGGRSITIQTEVGAVPPVSGDESALRDVLINLIFNAVDAMQQGGTIRIRTFLDSQHTIALSVEDTGIGMPEEILKRCLEPFFTTKGERGTGLGLSIVHGIIQRHEGTLEITSQSGQGTHVLIRLPCVQERASEATVPSGAAPRSMRILLVDDEERVRKVMHTLLSFDGHHVEAADGASEALERFRRGHFDLVITDLAMPDGSGDQLARSIKELSSTIPVIMLTGFGDLIDAKADLPRGVDALLSKPARLDTLREAIKQVTANARLLYDQDIT